MPQQELCVLPREHKGRNHLERSKTKVTKKDIGGAEIVEEREVSGTRVAVTVYRSWITCYSRINDNAVLLTHV